MTEFTRRKNAQVISDYRPLELANNLLNLTRQYVENLPTPVVPVKFKQMHPLAVLPKYSKVGDAGMDLVATDKKHNKAFGFVDMGTGLVVEIPQGYVGLVFPRSSISKTYYTLSNCVGVIDSNFRGEIRFRFFCNTAHVIGITAVEPTPFELQGNTEYEVGDRIGQLIIMPYPTILPEWADELSDTERGDGGFGSSGR